MLFQEAGIPEFERKNLPLVWRGKNPDLCGAVSGPKFANKWMMTGRRGTEIEFIKNPGLFS